MTVENNGQFCAYCMPHASIRTGAVDQASKCGLPEVFHVSPRSRSIAWIFVWGDHASDLSEVFRLQANDVTMTWPAILYSRHPASPSGALFIILAGCHVRASAGDLAVRPDNLVPALKKPYFYF